MKNLFRNQTPGIRDYLSLVGFGVAYACLLLIALVPDKVVGWLNF